MSITDAAQLTGRSERTIRRALSANRFPGAFMVDSSSGPQWRIPRADLGAVFTIGDPDPQVVDNDDDRGDQDLVAELRAEVDQLRADLADAVRRAEVAEAIATERAAQVDDLREMVPPMVEAVRLTTRSLVEARELQAAPQDRRPRWWQRREG